MKLLLTLALVAYVAARPNNDYSRYENFDADELIGNVRLLSGYAKCFEGEGKCTSEAADFKKWMPNTIQSKCSDCSEHQKTLIARVVQAIIEKLPEDWEKLNKIHNPEAKYDAELKSFLEKYAKKE